MDVSDEYEVICNGRESIKYAPEDDGVRALPAGRCKHLETFS